MVIKKTIIHFIVIIKNLFLNAIKFSLYLFCIIRKNQVFVNSYYGDKYQGGLKVVCEYLLNKDSKLKIIFVVSDLSFVTPKDIIKVKYQSLKYYFLFFTSKVVVTNARNNHPKFKKHGQFFIQAWHGGFGGAKKVEKDVLSSLSKKYIKSAIRDGKHTDLMISSGSKQTELFYRSFWYSGPILECGSINYYLLFDFSKHGIIKKKIYDELGIPYNKKILLYAPTFRKMYKTNPYDVDFNRILKSLGEKFKNEFVVLIHYHKNGCPEHLKKSCDGNKLFDASSLEIAELEIAADIGLSDYSGFMLEMCLINKPVFRYANDLNDYIGERDLYVPFEMQPFPFGFNNDQLNESILKFDELDYKNKCETFLKEMGNIRSKDAPLFIATAVVDFLNAKSKKQFYYLYKDKLVWPDKK